MDDPRPYPCITETDLKSGQVECHPKVVDQGGKQMRECYCWLKDMSLLIAVETDSEPEPMPVSETTPKTTTNATTTNSPQPTDAEIAATCRGNEIFVKCGGECREIACHSSKPPSCGKACVPGCYCKYGYYRDIYGQLNAVGRFRCVPRKEMCGAKPEAETESVANSVETASPAENPLPDPLEFKLVEEDVGIYEPPEDAILDESADEILSNFDPYGYKLVEEDQGLYDPVAETDVNSLPDPNGYKLVAEDAGIYEPNAGADPNGYKLVPEDAEIYEPASDAEPEAEV